MGSKGYRVVMIDVRTCTATTTIYPANRAAKLFAKIAGTKGFDQCHLAWPEQLGFSHWGSQPRQRPSTA